MNETSYRYSVADGEYYTPSMKEVRSQSKNNKQCGGDVLQEHDAALFICNYQEACDYSFETYERAIGRNVSREIARGMLPQSTYTEFYWKIDLHNLLHFLNLRMHPHAQEQIRAYANIMFDMVKERFPITVEAFEDYVLHAKTFSRQQMELLREIIATGSFDPINPHENLSARETQDLLDAIGWIETGAQK
jgi:thymidylate synthase (FAD)